jgi:hypothetical protein
VSYEEDPIRQANISFAVAVNATAKLASAQKDDDPTKYFAENLPIVAAAMEFEQGAALARAGLGATPATNNNTPPGNVVPFLPKVVLAPEQAFTPAPTPIPGATDGDPQVAQHWAAFFQQAGARQVARSFGEARTGQWFDNRGPGKNPRAPDFKVKAERGLDSPAVWLDDKKNPSWVAQQMQALGV